MLKTAFVITTTLILASNFGFAGDSLDYTAFSGTFRFDAENSDRECKFSNNQLVQFKSSPIDHKIEAQVEGGYPYKIEDINQGKKKFNSCWSDGLMGYTEAVGKGKVLKYREVTLKPGFFCTGGFEDHSLTSTWEIKADVFIMKDKRSSEWLTTTCKFKKVKSMENLEGN